MKQRGGSCICIAKENFPSFMCCSLCYCKEQGLMGAEKKKYISNDSIEDSERNPLMKQKSMELPILKFLCVLNRGDLAQLRIVMQLFAFETRTEIALRFSKILQASSDASTMQATLISQNNADASKVSSACLHFSIITRVILFFFFSLLLKKKRQPTGIHLGKTTSLHTIHWSAQDPCVIPLLRVLCRNGTLNTKMLKFEPSAGWPGIRAPVRFKHLGSCVRTSVKLFEWERLWLFSFQILKHTSHVARVDSFFSGEKLIYVANKCTGFRIWT